MKNIANFKENLFLTSLFICSVLSFSWVGMVSATEWFIGTGGDSWIENTTFDNTTVKYRNIELLNGWDPSNVVHIQSGGSRNYLKSPDRKQAMRFTSPTSKKITKIGVLPCCYYPDSSQPNWSVGIQTDNNGLPSGTYLGSGILYGPNIPDEAWQFIDIFPEVSLTEGNNYWIVIQYHSGPTPTESNHWIGFRAEAPAKDFMTDDIPLPCNCVGLNKNINDKGTTTIRLFDGTSWVPDPGNRRLGLFILTFDDATYYGQPYQHRYFSIYDSYQAGEIFTIDLQDKTVDKLEIPWNVFHYGGAEERPEDDLYYYIKENNQNGPIIHSGIFLTREEVYVTNAGGGNGAQDRRWYSKIINPPITLEKGKTYFLYFASPNTSSESLCWGSDAGEPMYGPEDPFANTSYDKKTSYFRRTKDNWAHVLADPLRDLSFRFHLVDVFEGNITSIEKDAESIGSEGDVWKQIKFEGSIPSGTSVSIYVNSPNCGGFVKIKDNAVSGIIYDLPYYAQERYASWRLILHTNNSSITPEIYSVTFIGSKSIVTGTIPEKELVYPNPYIKGKSLNERINFSNLPKETTINIYTVSGELVKIIRHKNISSGGNAHWDISAIASGIYIYYIESPQGKNTGKVSIIK